MRPARPDDAPAIGDVHARAWAQAYGALLPASAVPAAGELAQAWQQSLAAPPSPRHRVLVATAGERLVGFAALAPASDADSEPTDAEKLAFWATTDTPALESLKISVPFSMVRRPSDNGLAELGLAAAGLASATDGANRRTASRSGSCQALLTSRPKPTGSAGSAQPSSSPPSSARWT